MMQNYLGQLVLPLMLDASRQMFIILSIDVMKMGMPLNINKYSALFFTLKNPGSNYMNTSQIIVSFID